MIKNMREKRSLRPCHFNLEMAGDFLYNSQNRFPNS